MMMMIDTYLYSEELPADEVLRLRVFLLRRARPRQATSPASQVEQQYGAASTLTSSPVSISHSRAASTRKGAQMGFYCQSFESNISTRAVCNKLTDVRVSLKTPLGKKSLFKGCLIKKELGYGEFYNT